jgi:hypothetical protein
VKTISLKKVSAIAVASLAIGTFTAIAPAQAIVTGFTISNKASSKVDAAIARDISWATVDTVTTLTFTAGDLVVADIGKGIWGDLGYVCALGAIAADAANPTTATCATATTLANNNVVTNSFRKGTIATTTVASGVVAGTISGMSIAAGASGSISLSFAAGFLPADAAATGRMTIGGTLVSAANVASTVTTTSMIIPFTAPVVAGTYAATVQYSAAGTYTGVGNDTFSTPFTLTVTALSGLSAGTSTALIRGDNTAAVATSATDAIAVTSSATASTANSASMTISLRDAAAVAMTAGNTISATVTGSGYVRWVTGDDVPQASQCVVTPTFSATLGRSVTAQAADAVGTLYVCADGTAGKSTVVITIADAAGVSQALSTKTLTFFGAVTKLAATPVLTIGTAGGATTGNAAADRATAAVIPAVIIKATDKDGVVVAGLTITGLSSNLAAVNSTITVNADLSTAAFTSGGAGFYNTSFSTTAVSKSGDRATLTFRTVDPADATKFISVDVALTVGGSVATEVLSFDKTSYAPGGAMVVTITAKDSAGNPVADGTASPAITFSKAVGGATPTTSVYVGGKKATSATAPTVFAPTIPGAFSALATSTNAAATALTAAATVADANAGLLTQIDALNAKIVALNALIAKIMKKLGVK